ncbi:hypothetical protein JOF29_007655 [Kribbella aluminosa]|uniref:ATP/GTP-binding protein n=1 Tax=Kribbella aluminosa TaxID=416017 RepID=A0ABS4UY39_9ACTN|nr:hypothetical protein [Kribbella aluminosa]MBP2356545.1 hypothetical protein [Kribbella aluminosa]
MLKSLVALVLATFSFVSAAPLGMAAPGSAAEPKPKVDLVHTCPTPHNCFWVPRAVVNQQNNKTIPGTKPGKSVTKGPERLCLLGGASQACTSNLGNWSNTQQCYLERLEPQPPKGNPAWQGHTDGAIWTCVREDNGGRRFVTKWVWLPGKPDTVVPDPITLVYQAIAEMRLAPPLIKTAPGAGQIGLVNMPVWMWVTKSENTWGPIVRSASVPGLSVTVTAQVKAINWSMGDGSTVRCDGPGTPYDKSMGVKNSPSCGHRYVKTSHKLPNCKYPVTAVAQWDITWLSTLGDTGQISKAQQAATQLRIGEAVPVLVDPAGGETTTKSGC